MPCLVSARASRLRSRAAASAAAVPAIAGAPACSKCSRPPRRCATSSAPRPTRGRSSVPPPARARPGSPAAGLDGGLDWSPRVIDPGRLRSPGERAPPGVPAGEGLGGAFPHPPQQSPPIYVALVRVGEASGTLDHILEVL